jgi:hypothetical protein
MSKTANLYVLCLNQYYFFQGQYTYIYRCIKDAIEDPTIVNPGECNIKRILKYISGMTEMFLQSSLGLSRQILVFQ